MRMPWLMQAEALDDTGRPVLISRTGVLPPMAGEPATAGRFSGTLWDLTSSFFHTRHLDEEFYFH
jgi:hypothetical protein